MEKPQKSIISFDAKRLVYGAAYHGIDEGFVLAWDTDSLKRQFTRLRKAKTKVQISRSCWESLSNFSRLVWLLKRSDCKICFDADGIGYLMPEKAKCESRSAQRTATD